MAVPSCYKKLAKSMFYTTKCLGRKTNTAKLFLGRKSAIMLSLTSYEVSSKKFHQIAIKIKPNQILHQTQEENILSKYLRNQQVSFLQQPFPLSSKNKKRQSISNTANTRVNYRELLVGSGAKGSVLQKSYRQKDLLLIGMNYNNLSYPSLYKVLSKFNPDAILLQSKPDLWWKKIGQKTGQFQVIKKHPKEKVFSDRLYLDQLRVDTLLDWQENFSEFQMSQLESLLFPRKTSNSQQKVLNDFLPFLNKEITSSEKPFLVSLFWYLKTVKQGKQLPLYLSQLPQSVHRQWLANSLTLMELEELFKVVCKSLPLYSGLNLTPYQLAAYLYPQHLLAVNDKYMATLIQTLIAMDHKKIALLSSPVQNQAIWDILANQKHVQQQDKKTQKSIVPIIEYLVAPKVKGNLLRDFQPFEVLEKHILLDCLYNGKDFTSIPLKQFETTNKIIEKYLVGEAKEMVMRFRYQMGLKYSELYEQCVKKGEERKKKEFMRKVIRDQLE